MTPPSPEALPALRFDPQWLLRAQDVGVLFLDVDGVLTDGGLYFTEAGETLKRFHTLDGHGIKLVMRIGIEVVVVSGRDSQALRKRLQALGVRHLSLGTEDKLPAAQDWLQRLGLDWRQAAAMGDDWPDLPLLRRAALACVPPHAHAEAKALAQVCTEAAAGQGAVREVCDLLLQAKGQYAALLREAAA
jgi:3-deoxy-D-manno-octulosonate 8-phosphate phosphatase (KDO 8-P phosphatase)